MQTMIACSITQTSQVEEPPLERAVSIAAWTTNFLVFRIVLSNNFNKLMNVITNGEKSVLDIDDKKRNQEAYQCLMSSCHKL